MGCGQGRDAIALAKLGYDVTGIDTSSVGIQQMVQRAESEGLQVMVIVGDIYTYRDYADYDFILLDSMLHFQRAELEQESELVRRVIREAKIGAVLVFCIQSTGTKLVTFNEVIANMDIKEWSEQDIKYVFKDKESRHVSRTDYKMIVIGK